MSQAPMLCSRPLLLCPASGPQPQPQPRSWVCTVACCGAFIAVMGAGLWIPPRMHQSARTLHLRSLRTPTSTSQPTAVPTAVPRQPSHHLHADPNGDLYPKAIAAQASDVVSDPGVPLVPAARGAVDLPVWRWTATLLFIGSALAAFVLRLLRPRPGGQPEKWGLVGATAEKAAGSKRPLSPGVVRRPVHQNPKVLLCRAVGALMRSELWSAVSSLPLQLLSWIALSTGERGAGDDGGVGKAKTVKRPPQQPAQPQYTNNWAPLTCKRHTLPHPAQPQHIAEMTPAGVPAAAADRTQRPDVTCEGKNR